MAGATEELQLAYSDTQDVMSLWTDSSQVLSASLMLRPHDRRLRIEERVECLTPSSLRRSIEFLIDVHVDLSAVLTSANGEMTPPDVQDYAEPEPLQGHRSGDQTDVADGASGDTRGTTEPRPSQRSTLSPAVIPIIAFAKDRLLDDAPVVSSGAGRLHVLNRRQATGIHKQVIWYLIMAELEAWIRGADVGDMAGRNESAREAATLLADIPGQSAAQARLVFQSAFSPQTAGTGQAAEYKRAIAATLSASNAATQLCTRLITHEYLFIVLPKPDSHRWLQVSIQYATTQSNESARSIGSYLRRLLNQLPDSYQIHVPLALQSQSYHFRMEGPTDHFVRLQAFETTSPSGGTRIQPEGSRTRFVPIQTPAAPAVILGRPTKCDREAHLYAGRLFADPNSPSQLFARVRFFERPPGLNGAAVVTSLAMLLLLIAFGVSIFRLAEETGGPNDVAALLVLTPGLASAVFIPGLFDRSVRQGPIRARAVLITTTVISIASALAVVVLDVWVEPGERLALWIALAVWLPLTAVELGCFFFAWRSARYARRAFETASEYRERSSGRPEHSSDLYDEADMQWIVELSQRGKISQRQTTTGGR
jgi:hypothetical protein